MNWISNYVRPKIRSLLPSSKHQIPENVWIRCPDSGQMVHHKDLEANQFVFPGSNYHVRMTAQQRFQHFFDGGEYGRVPVPDVVQDPLKFRDGRKYAERLKTAKAGTELDDAVLVGEGLLEGLGVVAAVQDFRFMAGSLGMAAGEAVIARMQEGILSLMQMPRTTIAVQRLREARLPYIVVLTDPTTGGVTASYAMLGDVHIAEPGALICFAGPRVIQQTIREQLPEGFQRAEYLLEHGMIDMVVHRHSLRATVAKLCRLMSAGGVTARAGAERSGGHLNGSAVDGRTIETLARASDVIDAEPVDDAQRVEMRQADKRDGDGKTKPTARDAMHN